MVSTAQRPRLLAIVGPTASGKSGLAMRLAKEFNGEIICADSRTVYKGMDIGTAKPTKAERAAVRHWGLDLVKPGQSYSAGKFKKYADDKIIDIQNRGNLPILVGGTGLYIDGVLYDYGFSLAVRERDTINPRHLKKGSKATRSELLPDAMLIGLLPPDGILKKRINKRVEMMFEQGVVEETDGLLKLYGPKTLTTTGGNIYAIITDLLRSKISLSEALEQAQTKDWQYARRQKTWFKRNPHINWFNDSGQAYKAVKKQLLNT